MRTSPAMLYSTPRSSARFILASLLFHAAVCQAQNSPSIKEREPFLQRMSFGAGGGYNVMHGNFVPGGPIELHVPSWSAFLAYRVRPRLTLRLLFAHSRQQARDRIEQVSAVEPWPGGDTPYHVVVHDFTVQERHWFDDVRLDLLLRPARWEHRGAGPYWMFGATVRDMFLEELGMDAVEEARGYPRMRDSDAQAWGAYLVLDAGAGYELRKGHWCAFAEAAALVSSQPAVLSAGDGLSLRYGMMAGVRYTIAR